MKVKGADSDLYRYDLSIGYGIFYLFVIVRELAFENKHGADVVMLGMNELTDNNTSLHDCTSSSMDMTTDINAQVQHVAAMIEEW